MKKKILIVEDEEMLAKVLVEQFNKAGFDVEAVFDGEEALESLKKSAPDLVLLDIILPKKNGFEVLKEIKENPDTQDIPVIMISNLGSDEDIKQSIKLGAADYYVKAQHPIYEITEKVSKFLSVPKSPLKKAKEPKKEAAAPLEAAARKPAEVIAEKPADAKKALKKIIEKVSPPAGGEKPVEKIVEKLKPVEVKKVAEKPAEKIAGKPKISPPVMPTGRQVGGEKIIEKKPFDLAQGKPAEIIAEKPVEIKKAEEKPIVAEKPFAKQTKEEYPQLSKGAKKFIRMKKAELHKMNLSPEEYEKETAKLYQTFSKK